MIRPVIDMALQLGNFFVAAGWRLRLEYIAEKQVPWEVFRSHLLPPQQAREARRFRTWNLSLDRDGSPATTPLISLKWQRSNSRLYITRQILTHGFEAYDEAPGVIESRPIQHWVAELVGSIAAMEMSRDRLSDEVAEYVLLAVIGTSRLPITSLESPLPAFSLGQLAYLPFLSSDEEVWNDAIAFFEAAVTRDLCMMHQAKALETALRAIPPDQTPRLAAAIARTPQRRRQADWLPSLCRSLFNNVALSPYTRFAERMVALLLELATLDSAQYTVIVDIVGYMLRHLCRHLTAYDLTVFHNLGANYPDALLLDALLKTYVGLLERQSELFETRPDDSPAVARQKRQRRRALRQAALVRKQYEGHRVPQAPTSMGENLRVLPAPFARVLEEQITQVARRPRALFLGEPLEGVLGAAGMRMFKQSANDLLHSGPPNTPADNSTDSPGNAKRDAEEISSDGELVELGIGHFLDRPFGCFKEPGEIDRTPLLSYEAFSRSIAKRRVRAMQAAGWLAAEAARECLAQLDEISIAGVPAASLAISERPGVVSLADANKAAVDFVFRRTMRRAVGDLLAHYDLSALRAVSPGLAAWLCAGNGVLLIPKPRRDGFVEPAVLVAYNDRGNPQLELGLAPPAGRMPRYRELAGVELLDRLRLLRVWDEQAPAAGHDLGDKNLWLTLCYSRIQLIRRRRQR